MMLTARDARKACKCDNPQDMAAALPIYANTLRTAKYHTLRTSYIRRVYIVYMPFGHQRRHSHECAPVTRNA